MKCAHCGADLPEDVNFCSNCGARIETRGIPAAPTEEAGKDENASLKTLHWSSDGYFPYKGKYFCRMTEVTLSDSFLEHYISPTFNKPVWKTARFERRVEHSRSVVKYLFYKKYEQNRFQEQLNFAPMFSLTEQQLEEAIESITKPIEVNVSKPYKAKDWEDPRIIVGWILYLLALFFSFIFTDWYIGWFAASVVFFTLRRAAKWR